MVNKWRAFRRSVKVYMCANGGIGRHARFRFWWETVGVQVPLGAPKKRSFLFQRSPLFYFLKVPGAYIFFIISKLIKFYYPYHLLHIQIARWECIEKSHITYLWFHI